ncbi:MAG: acylneuraminate cytidylyltransferase family protein [bacterium]|nr:acylneuraminate cytidylyltransferase family protein [bacterium]
MAEILAIIPARGGSKGIPSKNIRDFAGKPLIVHTINQAKNAKHINRIIVSTDSEEIADVAKKNGVGVPFLRPPELAGDKSLIVDVVIDILDRLKKEENYIPDLVMLLQPTNPLRTSEDIEGVLALLASSGADATVTICSTENLLYTRNEKGFINLVPGTELFLSSPNRQELSATYRLDGSMIYVVKTQVLITERTFLPNNLAGYVIPNWRAVDIDEPEDFVVGELIMKNKDIIGKNVESFK